MLRKVEPLPTPVATNRIMNRTKNGHQYASGAASDLALTMQKATPSAATTWTMVLHVVTFDPLLILSENHPPIGRISAPTIGPKNAQVMGLGALGLTAPSGKYPKTSWISFGNEAEDPIKEPKAIT